MGRCYLKSAWILVILLTINISTWACTAPEADVVSNSSYAFVGYPVLFDGNGSAVTASGERLVKYEWDFLDGGANYTEGESIETYTYDTASSYVVYLQVTDSTPMSDTDNCSVDVRNQHSTASCVRYYVDSLATDDTGAGSQGDPKKTIQAAINLISGSYGAVEVAEGTYTENIDFGTKVVYLTSENPNDPCVVDSTIVQGVAEANSPVIEVDPNNNGSVIIGLTVTGGDDGGIQGNNSYVHVDRCVVTGNTKSGPGVGIQKIDGLITNCSIVGNGDQNATGGGLGGCDGRIQNCLIADNVGTTSGVLHNCSGEIINCTITGYVAGSSSYLINGSKAEIINCIIWNNEPNEIQLDLNDAPFVSYSCVENLTSNEVKPSSYWQLDEGSGTITEPHADYGSIDGTLINGASWETTYGQVNTAISLDGSDDYINLGDDSSLEPNLPMTISVWIEPNAIGSAMTILTLGGETGAYSGIWLSVNSDGALEIAYGDGDGTTSQDYRKKVGSPEFELEEDGGWYHVVAIIRDATDMDLYVNGELDYNATYSGTGDTLYHDSISRIGADNSAGNTFDGLIDEVAIYEVSLSAAEVYRQYENGWDTSNDDYLETGNMDDNPIFNNACDMVDITVSTSEANNVIVVADASSYDDEEDIVIEIDNDGVVHTVTNVVSNTITFTPALASNCPEGTPVYKWPTGTTDLDEDYHLQGDSPCIDTGDDSVVSESFDIDGMPRQIDGDLDSVVVVDMGAYEALARAYVDINVQSSDDSGTSWENAFTSIKSAVEAVVTGGEIWVAEGTYTEGPIYLTKKDVFLYGGFDGEDSVLYSGGETLLSQRDLGNIFVLNGNGGTCIYVQSITANLDGLIVYNASTGIYCYGEGNLCLSSCIITECSRHGINFLSPGENSHVSNCVIEDNTNGIYISNGSPEISSCDIIDNIDTSTSGSGAGIYIASNASPGIENCWFEGNETNGNYGHGGAIFCSGSSAINRCVFNQNEADREGGAVCLFSTSETDQFPEISNCMFVGNQITEDYYEAYGGAIYVNGDEMNLDIYNCLFVDNGNYDCNGGAIAFRGATSTNIVNCTFSYNDAKNGGAVYNENYDAVFGSVIVNLKNCLLWPNDADEDGHEVYCKDAGSSSYKAYIKLYYCDIYATDDWWYYDGEYGGIDVNDCFAADPNFKNTNDIDGADNILMTSDDGFALDPTIPSPCINAGSNSYTTYPIYISYDITGSVNRRNNSTADIGCYEKP